MVTQRGLLIVQQEQLLRLAVSDYIDRIVDGRALRQRVFTQPRPNSDIKLKRLMGFVRSVSAPPFRPFRFVSAAP